MNKEIKEIVKSIRFSDEEFEQAKRDVKDLFHLLKKNKIPAFPLLDSNLFTSNSKGITGLADVLEAIEIINPDYERIYLSHGQDSGKIGFLTKTVSLNDRSNKETTIFYVYDAKNKIFFYFKNKEFLIYNVDNNLELQKFETYDSPERLLLLMKKEVGEWNY